jgi:hypothetical protein
MTLSALPTASAQLAASAMIRLMTVTAIMDTSSAMVHASPRRAARVPTTISAPCTLDARGVALAMIARMIANVTLATPCRKEHAFPLRRRRATTMSDALCMRGASMVNSATTVSMKTAFVSLVMS